MEEATFDASPGCEIAPRERERLCAGTDRQTRREPARCWRSYLPTATVARPRVSERKSRRSVTAAGTNTGRRRNRDAQNAADFGPDRACDRPALDRSGNGHGGLAEVELHDQRDPVGGLRRGAVGDRPDPDLAEPAPMTTDLFDLKGKTAIVTGGNGGIGLGIARGLADAGADIAVVGRNEAQSKAAADELAARRWGAIDDFAEIAVLLASSASDFV